MYLLFNFCHSLLSASVLRYICFFFNKAWNCWNVTSYKDFFFIPFPWVLFFLMSHTTLPLTQISPLASTIMAHLNCLWFSLSFLFPFPFLTIFGLSFGNKLYWWFCGWLLFGRSWLNDYFCLEIWYGRWCTKNVLLQYRSLPINILLEVWWWRNCIGGEVWLK